jgi:hypothetical protein
VLTFQGKGELAVLQKAEEHRGRLEVFLLRPGPVLGKTSSLSHAVFGKTWSIKVDDLAAALLDSAMNGGSPQIEENREVVARGERISRAQVVASG